MQLLTTEEAARRLSLTPETVRRFLRSGELRGVKVGRVHRIEEGEISAYVERLKAGALPVGEVSREEARSNGFGFLKGRVSSDAFLEEKHAQARRELERDERRQGKQSEVAA